MTSICYLCGYTEKIPKEDLIEHLTPKGWCDIEYVKEKKIYHTICVCHKCLCKYTLSILKDKIVPKSVEEITLIFRDI